MKEMYYSEVLNKYFNSKGECRKAELQHELEQQAAAKKAKKAEAAKKDELTAASKEKKELSRAIDDAETKLSEAYHAYELAREEAKKLEEEYSKKVNDILNPAKDNLKQAQKHKYEAISNFNNKYGTYSVVYTGDRAFDELKRTSEMLDSLFNRFWF